MDKLFTKLADLESLVENGAVESLQLEFKRFKATDGKLEPKDKETLGKEIVAMANSEGGHIIIGIDEDGKRCAAKLTDAGLTPQELDGLQLSIQQYLLAKVRPRLYGVTYTGIIVADNNIAVVIYVPKSFSRPHALNDGSKDIFYIRHSNGVTNMSVDDLRKQFLSTSSIRRDIQAFRNERIGAVMSDEGSIELIAGARLLIHIIPLWSLQPGNSIDLAFIRSSNLSGARPLFVNSYNYNYNSDGFITFSTEHKGGGPYGKVNSYIQFFRHGTIELAEARAMNYGNKRIYSWPEIASGIYNKLLDCLKLLSGLNVPAPIYIYISLISAKGFFSIDEYCECASDKDIVNSVECIYDGESALYIPIRPTFDSLANAFGAERSYNFDKDGCYIES